MPKTMNMQAGPLRADGRRERETRLAAELDVLQALCNVRMTAERRAELLRALGTYAFIEPEHQVLSEAIRALSRGLKFPPTALIVVLNNRGFPDLDLGRYSVDRMIDWDHVLTIARQLSSGDLPSDDVR